MPVLLTPIVEQAQSDGHFPPGEWRALWMPRDPGRAVALVFPRGSDHPRLVVKAEPAPGEKLSRERDILWRIHTGGNAFAGEVPRVLAWREEAGRVLLATDVMEGRPLKRASARLLRRAMLPGVDWLLKFNRALGEEWAQGEAGWERGVLPHVESYRRNYVASAEAGRVMEETFDPHPLAGPPALRKRGRRVPQVLRHGDYNTANVL